MSAPRLLINLDKIFHNASTLAKRLQSKGISVTGVTKAFLGAPKITRVLVRAGVASLGDSRVENIERMRQAGIDAQMMLIRSPMLSQVDRVVASVDISFNTELEVITALSMAAVRANKTHGVLLMVELGDLREGIMPWDVEKTVQAVYQLPNIKLMGLGANLACRNGVAPDNRNMAELSALATSLTPPAALISGGNSSNLEWVFAGGTVGGINNLRLGEALLLGREALNRQPIDGLLTDAISLVAEVIESKTKPSMPWGTIAQSAFTHTPTLNDIGTINQAIIAIGRQDTDPDGLEPPAGIQVLDASSDHLVLNTDKTRLPVGSELTFQLNYSALLRAMTSPHITKAYIGTGMITKPRATHEILPNVA